MNTQVAEPTTEDLIDLQGRIEDAIEQQRLAESRNRWASWSAVVASGAKHSYEGTVPAKTIAARRKRAKAARAARKANR